MRAGRACAAVDEFTGPAADDLDFVGPLGGAVRRSHFQKHWVRGTRAAGVEGLHLHDLRHTSNTWAAESGATLMDLMDLMDRMGHASTKAALLYLHRSGARDRAIADALSAMVERAQQPATEEEKKPEGLGVDDAADVDPEADGHTTR